MMATVPLRHLRFGTQKKPPTDFSACECTTRFNIQKFYVLSTHCMSVLGWISEQTAIMSPQRIGRLDFTTDIQFVCCVVHLNVGTRILTQYTLCSAGTAKAQWLRYCATNPKVAGSIADGVMESFNDINPSYRTMAVGSTQSLT
jgi:hypothetical protein